MCLRQNYKQLLLLLPADAIADSGDDPEVIRAKYFIRDEFLVSFLFTFHILVLMTF